MTMLVALRVLRTTTLPELLRSIQSSGAQATLVDATAVQSSRQLQAAYELAKQSMAEGTAISGRIEIEFLLWLGQTTHVQKAIGRVGVKEGGGEAVLAVFGAPESDAAALAKKLGLEVMRKQAFAKMDGKKELRLLEQMALSRLND